MTFQLVPKSVTLNGVMAVILRYFSEFGSFPGALRKSSRSLSHLMNSCLVSTESGRGRCSYLIHRPHRTVVTRAVAGTRYLGNKLPG